MNDTPWIDASAEDDVWEDQVMAAQVGGREIALYRVEGRIYATDNTCTHGRARLCEGFLEGFEIECPMHQGRFDVRDGRATCEPVTVDIRTYPVRIEGGRVFLCLGD